MATVANRAFIGLPLDGVCAIAKAAEKPYDFGIDADYDG